MTFEIPGSPAVEVQGKSGYSLMEVAVRNNVPGILAECGGACACATCHVYVNEEWMGTLPERTQTEEDMLEFAENVGPFSRLSCQIRLTEQCEGLLVAIPISSLNKNGS